MLCSICSDFLSLESKPYCESKDDGFMEKLKGQARCLAISLYKIHISAKTILPFIGIGELRELSDALRFCGICVGSLCSDSNVCNDTVAKFVVIRISGVEIRRLNNNNG